MADRYLLESSAVDGYLLEDGTGVLLLDAPSTNYVLTCNHGTYSYTGQSATLAKSKVIVASAGAYTYTGRTANLYRSKVIVASAGNYSYTGQSANLYRNRTLIATNGTYAYAGQDAILTYTPGAVNYTLTALHGTYSYAGQSATINRNRALSASFGAYAYSGQSVTLKHDRTLTCQHGVYTYTGWSIEFIYSGAPLVLEDAPQPGAAKGSRSKSRNKYLEVDGKLIPFNSEQEIIAYLDSLKESKVEEARQIVEEVAERAISGISVEVPKVAVAPVDFRASKAIIERIKRINRDIELAYLLKLEHEAEMDDEESILLLL
jgi:hypothetical protein